MHLKTVFQESFSVCFLNTSLKFGKGGELIRWTKQRALRFSTPSAEVCCVSLVDCEVAV
jgi:hypothetical protein